jgi:5-methylcytosine-specific restriction enzyme subunit McrC
MDHDPKIVVENRWESWARITSQTGSHAAAAQVAVLNAGTTIKRRLGLRNDPFKFRGSAEGIQFQASGLAGSLSLREVSLEITPKFASGPEQLADWNTGALFLLEALAGKHVMALLAERQQWKSHRVVDLIAHAFADAVERGFREQPILIYRQNEVSSVVLRGRLNIARQVRNVVHAPYLLECDVDELDPENPFNDVLKWAATVLSGLAIETGLRMRLAEFARAIPGDIERSASHRYHRLLPPPQFQAWSDALELARLLAGGMTLSSIGGQSNGYSLLFNMERAFERFVEVALGRVIETLGTGGLSTNRQEWKKYADPLSPGGKVLGCIPDNVIRWHGTPSIVVDAKYKLLDRDLLAAQQEIGAPISQDVYELVAGIIANDCRSGILIYPTSSPLETKGASIRVWSVNAFGTAIRVGALPVNLLSLRSRTDLSNLIQHVGQEMATFMKDHWADGVTS